MKNLLKVACFLIVSILFFNGCSSDSEKSELPIKSGSEFFDENDTPENIAFLSAQRNETDPTESYMREIPAGFYGSGIQRGVTVDREAAKMMEEKMEVTAKFYEFLKAILSNMILQPTKEKPNEKSEYFTLTNKKTNKYLQIYDNNQIRYFEKGHQGSYWKITEEDMKMLKSVIEFYKENLGKLHEYQIHYLKTLEEKE